jgi:hypothetical protein
MKFSKKLNMKLPYDPEISLQGVYWNEMKSVCWRDVYNLIFIATLFTIAKKWVKSKCTLNN